MQAAPLQPALIVFSGLPGVGKTTLARRVADVIGATLLRIDTIEAAVARSGLVIDGSPVGYLVANRVAADQLRGGRTVVSDAVNNVEVARTGWDELAADHGLQARFVVVACSDPVEHQRRIEARPFDPGGHPMPTWDDVRARTWEPWRRPHLAIDNLGDPEVHATHIVDWLERGA